MTSLSAPRPRLLLPRSHFRLALAAIFFGALGLTLVLLRHLAHAAQVVTDPLGTAQTTVDGAASLLTTYGPATGGMYLLYQVANAVVARRAQSSWLAAWLAQGKRLAWTTSVLGVVGAALQVMATGAPWTAIAMAAIAAAFKLMHPTVPAPAASSPLTKVPQAGIVLLVLVAACGAAQHGGHAVIDCTGGNASGVTANILATLTDWNKPKTDGGCRTESGYDWPCIKGAAIAKGVQVGGCALAELVQDLLSPPAARTASVTALAQAGPDDSATARATLEGFRAEHAGGAVFRFATGDR